MSWPQITIAVCLLAGAISTISSTARNKEISSPMAAFLILFAIAFVCAEAAVLSAGGFW